MTAMLKNNNQSDFETANMCEPENQDGFPYINDSFVNNVILEGLLNESNISIDQLVDSDVESIPLSTLKNRINSNSGIEVATDQVSPLSCDLINDTQDSDHVSSSCNAMNNPPTDHLDSRSTKQTSESSLRGRLSKNDGHIMGFTYNDQTKSHLNMNVGVSSTRAAKSTKKKAFSYPLVSELYSTKCPP